MNINGLEFEQTCVACPEQYNVKNKDGKIIAYVRLRWGLLTARYVKDDGSFGKDFYATSVSGSGGTFDTDAMRMFHLKYIAQLLNGDKEEKEIEQDSFKKTLEKLRNEKMVITVGMWMDMEERIRKLEEKY